MDDEGRWRRWARGRGRGVSFSGQSLPHLPKTLTPALPLPLLRLCLLLVVLPVQQATRVVRRRPRKHNTVRLCQLPPSAHLEAPGPVPVIQLVPVRNQLLSRSNSVTIPVKPPSRSASLRSCERERRFKVQPPRRYHFAWLIQRRPRLHIQTIWHPTSPHRLSHWRVPCGGERRKSMRARAGP